MSGAFRASVNRAYQLLKRAEIAIELNSYVNYSSFSPGFVRGMDYIEQWKVLLRRRWYDIRLSDQSLLQFKETPTLSFSFIQCPLQLVTLEDFGVANLGPEWRMLSTEIEEEYNLYIGSMQDERPATPIRFDYEPNTYLEGIHPAAHLHFGFESSVRVGLQKIADPYSFTLFVLRQSYPLLWSRIRSGINVSRVNNALWNSLTPVPAQYWGAWDKAEWYV